jgi:diguanylate cyclase (GGDEF)-like protein/PAS domain S-box-containing protein
VVLIEAVMLSLLVWNSVRLIGSSHAELLEKSIGDEMQVLAYALAPGLAANDRATINDALLLLKDKRNLKYIHILDRGGNVIATKGNYRESPLDKTFRDAESDGVFDTRTDIRLYGQKLGTLHAGYSISHVKQLTRKTRNQNTLIAATELLLSVIATVLLGIFLTRSLKKLEQGVRSLEQGDLKTKIDIQTGDEIEDVANSFNKLVTSLGRYRNDLISKNRDIRREKQHRETLLNSINAVIVEADPYTCRFHYVSQEAGKLLGIDAEKWLAPDFYYEHIHPEDVESVRQEITRHLEAGDTYTMDYRMIGAGGNVVWVRSINSLDINADEQLVCRGLMLDITEHKHTEEHVMYLADHDSLTGLYNRRRFNEELEHAIALARRYDKTGALMFIDLDQFKVINDSLGHHAGDEFLVHVAAALNDSIRDVDVLGRLGGDEFGIIVPEVDKHDAEGLARNMLNRLSTHKFSSKGQEASIGASVGIVIFPEHGLTPNPLMARADAAMYSAKENGRNCVYLYEEDDRGLETYRIRFEWEDRIRKALECDNFMLYLQPVYRVADNSSVYYEVLVRMKAEGGKAILPSLFMETAERCGLIRDIDLWVIREAIILQAKSRSTDAPLVLSINLSGRHVGDQVIMEEIRSVIQEYGADASSLIFEVTETEAVKNMNQARYFIDVLHGLGCRFALDDFGVGYASFHYLRNLPVDIVKIDGSFIRQLDVDNFDKVFVKSIQNLADALGISTVAEFVESAGIYQALSEIGVENAQGYHLSRPAPASEIIGKLNNV